MKQKEDLMFTFRGGAGERMLLDALTEELNMSQSDVIRIALWEYANAPKNNLFKSSLKELARQKIRAFHIDNLRELEYINNKVAFFFDGFRTMMGNYKNKHVPLPYVKKYVSIKLVAMYSLFSGNERQGYMNYIKKHFLYYYPSESKWIEQQIKFVRKSKKLEKDKILEGLNVRRMPQMQELERSSRMPRHKKDALLEMHAEEPKAMDYERKGKA